MLLYPPESRENLYYANRKDIQARYAPGRGEYGRHDTGIVSQNTAEVNGANPDLHRFPKFRHALEAQSYAELRTSDCLYLPNGWHHHVFSEADLDAGYNLAINIWVHREETLASRLSGVHERFPFLSEVVSALERVSHSAPEGSCASDDG